MSKQSYTPGPWSWGAAYGHHSTMIVAECGRVIGTVRDCEQNGVDKHGMHVWEQTQQGRANARLIAAAPDLLEALQWAMGTGLLSYTRKLPGQNDAWCDSVDKARAAIAKALGE